MICPSCLVAFEPTTAAPTHSCPGYRTEGDETAALRGEIASLRAALAAAEKARDEGAVREKRYLDLIFRMYHAAGADPEGNELRAVQTLAARAEAAEAAADEARRERDEMRASTSRLCDAVDRFLEDETGDDIYITQIDTLSQEARAALRAGEKGVGK